jgi:hypothetical protein
MSYPSCHNKTKKLKIMKSGHPQRSKPCPRQRPLRSADFQSALSPTSSPQRFATQHLPSAQYAPAPIGNNRAFIFYTTQFLINLNPEFSILQNVAQPAPQLSPRTPGSMQNPQHLKAHQAIDFTVVTHATPATHPAVLPIIHQDTSNSVQVLSRLVKQNPTESNQKVWEGAGPPPPLSGPPWKLGYGVSLELGIWLLGFPARFSSPVADTSR